MQEGGNIYMPENKIGFISPIWISKHCHAGSPCLVTYWLERGIEFAGLWVWNAVV